jgi:hypothetical protein
MKAILIFIDGTICDGRHRYHLADTPEFYQRETMLADLAVPGSLQALQELARRYQLVYIGARPESTLPVTEEWLRIARFPPGEILVAESQDERLALVKELRTRYDFIAGIGDRWDDNELHAELRCLSIILQEHAGNFPAAVERIASYHRESKIRQNETHLHGKIEGLARICPLLQAEFGEQLWESFFKAVAEQAESTRAFRRAEDLASIAHYQLDPGDLSDVARWVDQTWEDEWEDNPAYGLQEFETVEASQRRYAFKVTRCRYAELWTAQGHPEIGYQIHCHTDQLWWDHPAWNSRVRFEQPKTLMQGDDYCLFIQYLPEEDSTVEEDT